ncbi:MULTISPECIES: phage tail protein [Nonlabens]|uniref:Microcystin-dependent protein n=1 Tax=Nonlabens xylanidelens TaxID=191564 RepID=A0A2S6IJA2_9FLAO|nr:tail fiber protein [Nonlabens xylanidelens]PPK94297.1 microcystin-dependent protein [Nonlabens xylanidelens]
MKKTTFILLFMLLGSIYNVSAQDDFIGEVKMFAGNFAPRGWALCQGQLLPIAQNSALFSIIGTTYGGDGRTTFGLPDLRGRVPEGVGTGPGLSPVQWGQRSGAETVTLTTANLPSHNHAVNGVSEVGTTNVPSGAYPANSGVFDNEYGTGTSTPMHAGMIGYTGGGQSVSIKQPSLGMHYIICLQGIFPSRS